MPNWRTVARKLTAGLDTGAERQMHCNVAAKFDGTGKVFPWRQVNNSTTGLVTSINGGLNGLRVIYDTVTHCLVICRSEDALGVDYGQFHVRLSPLRDNHVLAGCIKATAELARALCKPLHKRSSTLPAHLLLASLFFCH